MDLEKQAIEILQTFPVMNRISWDIVAARIRM